MTDEIAVLGPGAHGEQVSRLHAGLLALGLSVPDEELVANTIAAGTRRALLELQRSSDLPATGVADERVQDLLAEETRDRRFVVGRVVGPDGSPLEAVTLRAFDREIRGERPLGSAKSDADGYYRIDYSAAKTPDAVGSADVFVRAYSGRTQLTDPPLGEVVFNAPALVSIPVFVATATAPPETEIELVRRVAGPALSELAWSDLKEDDEHRDVTFLVRETGLPQDAIEHLAVAERIAREYGGPVECWYAVLATDLLVTARRWASSAPLLAIGVATSSRDILLSTALVPAKERREAVLEAVKGFLVPRATVKQLDELEAVLKRYSDEAESYQRTERLEVAFRQIQHFVGSEARDEVLRLLREDPLGDLGGVVDRLQAAGTLLAEHAASVKTTLSLADLLGDDQQAIHRLSETHGIKHPSDLRRLATLGEEDWAGVIDADREAGRAATKRATRQAATLTRLMEKRFPTAAFAGRLRRDEAASLPRAHDVAAVLEEEPEFDLATGNVVRLLKERAQRRRTRSRRKSPPRPKELAAEAELRSSMMTTQRVFKIAPRYRQAATLISRGIASSADVVGLGQSRFVTLALESGEFDAAEATLAYHKAEGQHTAAMLLAGQILTAKGATTLGALASTSAALQAVAEDFPNMRTLFGTGDFGSCEECRSAHGASAYLVDVLQFLKRRLVLDTTTSPAVTLKQAKDVLFARRPDLGDLDLSCPNTNTALPYIDLVCELLEEAVAPNPGVAYNGAVAAGIVDTALVAVLQAQGWAFTDAAAVSGPDLSGDFVVRDATAVAKLTPDGGGWRVRRLRQTYGTAAEVAAAPEYVNQAAYAVLAGASSAFGLPFDLGHAETTGYFDLLDLRRADLMALLESGGAPSAAEAAADRFGLSSAEHALVVTPDPAGQDTVWDTPAAATALENVDAFVKRSGITYASLLELIDLAWVDGGQNLFVRHLDSTNDLSAKEIANLDDAALDRTHRFERLRRATGLTAATLDRAVRHPLMGAGNLDDLLLARLAVARSVEERLRLTTDRLLDVFGPLDSGGQTYRRVFLAETSVGVVAAEFLPEAVLASETAEAAVPGTGTRLAGHTEYIARALGAGVADVAALFAEQGGDPPLTTASLSRVHGLWRLAQAFRLRGAELVDLIALTGLDPVAGLADLDSFTTRVDAVAGSGIRPSRLRYLLHHAADDLAALEPAPDSVTSFVTDLNATLAEARVATRSPYDDQAAPMENATAIAAHVALLPGLSVADQSTLATLVADEWTDAVLSEDAFVDAVLASYFDTSDLKAALAARAAAPAGNDAARNDVIEELGAGVSGHLLDLAHGSALAFAVAALTGVAEETARVLVDHTRLGQGGAGTPLIRDVLLDESGAAAATASKESTARLLTKITAAFSGYEPSDNVLAWVLDHAPALGWLEWDSLPYQTGQAPASLDAWGRLHGFFGLLAAFPDVAGAPGTAPYSLTGLFELVLDPATTASRFLAYAAALTGLDPAMCVELDAHLGFSAVSLNQYRDPVTLTRLVTATSMLRQLGVDVGLAIRLAAPAVTPADATALRTAVKARYTDAEWLGVLGQVQDGLRERKRDALVAYLLATTPSINSTNELYDYFLIDVETAACMDTSRIVQAHATLQLFAIRCLMGLEPESVATVKHDDGWKRWEWMANFRVWEANRKIFLWPENWLEPDLRDDKSELYVKAEQTLQQNPLTEVAIEDVMGEYLESLGDIAHLDVLTTYYEARTKTHHVFAKTKGGDPAVYLHREFQQERYWTPWKRVPIDITGEHLLAFDRNSRLTLAWPVFTEEPNTSKAPPAIPDPASLSGGKANDKPEKKWKIQLAVSERANGQWRPKRVSQGFIDTSYTQDLPALTEFNFFVWSLGTGQAITCIGPGGTVGSFALTGCKGYPEPTTAGGFSGLTSPRFVDTELAAGRFVELGQDKTDDLSILQLLGAVESRILDATPGQFKITYPMQMSLVDWVLFFAQAWFGLQTSAYKYDFRRRLTVPLGTLMPYFYGDYDRAYVVVPGFYERPRIKGDEQLAGAGTTERVRKTFSDVHQLLDDVIALLTKYLHKYAADPAQPLQDLVGELLADPEYVRIRAEIEVYRTLRYGLAFRNFYHPLVCAFRTRLNESGIPGLLDRDLQLTDTGFDFASHYKPTGQVVTPYPREDVDFSLEGAYSGYNWELFFHLPLAIATRLTRDQQFEEARRWLHYIFDPVGGQDAPSPNKYWATKPFFLTSPQEYLDQRIDSILNAIAADPAGATITELAFAVSEWRDKPFRPHVVARSRPVAFQIATVLAYVRNLVEWGDHLFRQFTRESVTQATQLYVLADKLLGEKPRIVPPAVPVPPKTFNELEPDVDLFGNALLDLEALIPEVSVLPQGGAELPPPPASLTALYFCIPPNSRMLEYWDLVADRLFKIRHCRNIDGTEMPLALFSPPLDPGALARAVVGGLSISSFMAGLGAPLPQYRFDVLVRKAAELTGQVGSLGTELLSVLERRDAEALAHLRADHEISLLAAMREVKVATRAEAEGSRRALRLSRDVVQARHDFYAGQEYMNTEEHLASLLNYVSLTGEAAVALGYVLSGGLKLIPNFLAGSAGFGGSAEVSATTGGQSIGSGAEMAAATLSSIARAADKGASMAATQAGYQRRMDEWTFHAGQAKLELAHLDSQIANVELHLVTLDQDLAAHDKQARNAAADLEAMLGKFTNQELYEWQAAQINNVYHQAYRLAFDVAKQAERCYGYELASDKTFIRFGYWDSQKKGLMAHHGLEHDIARMTAAYLSDNKREYELTKHISLAQLDPGALLQLKATGKATISIPETAFDLDYPGHYMRRIKTVAVTLACSAGPYTTVSATLSLISNKYRKSTAERQGAATPKDKYAEVLGSDERFAYNVGSVASIATSSAASDSGLFELSFHDERYLPFEGAGAISTWQVELPAIFEQVDRSTITDLVLHVRYTAQDGGSTLRAMTEDALLEISNEMLLSAQRSGWYAGINVREQFPEAWWQLTATGSTELRIGTEYLPFGVRSHSPAVAQVTWVATVESSPASYQLTIDGGTLTLKRDPQMRRICLATGGAFDFGDTVTVAANPAKLQDLTLLVHYTLTI